MAKYNSHYQELSFYVNGIREQFRAGEYETTDKATIDVLDTLSDAIKQADEKPQASPPKPEAPKAKAKAYAKSPSGK